MRPGELRHELKYVLPNDMLPAMRKAIEPFTQLDPNARGYEEVGYTVRSIYLDSPSLLYYREKQAHLQHRKKLRIRGYNQPCGDDVVLLEIKRKHTSMIEKERADMKYSDLDDLFESRHYADFIDPSTPDALNVGRRFFFHVVREQLRPTSLVVYEREAFHGHFDRNFRLTFDRDVRGGQYPEFRELFQEEGLREAIPGYFIMEVKFATRMPAWMGQVIAEFELMQCAASKYCMCVDLFDPRLDAKSPVIAPDAQWSGTEQNHSLS